MTLVGNVQVIEGNAAQVPELLTLLEKEGIEIAQNPDLSVRSYKNFGIDDARELSEKAAARAFGTRRVFVVTADSITNEAQNALLKTLEEAPGNSLFFFMLPNPERLLPTVRSRAQTISLSHSKTSTSDIDTRVFLKATPAKRLEMLKPLLEKGDDDTRDFGAILQFLSDLERALEQTSDKSDATFRAGIESVYRARKYAGDRGALVKPLLEQVALFV